VGDAVLAGETVVAVIHPLAPTLMDSRARAEAEAQVAEAAAAVALGEAHLSAALAARDHAARELERGVNLARNGTIPQRTLEDLQQAATLADQALAAAQAELDLNRARLARASALLIGPEPVMSTETATSECCVQIVAPVSGIVLAVEDRNSRQVMSGTPLLAIGDLAELEIETDLLSADAVRLPPDAPARITAWGGEGILAAKVRRIEPSAFTRISALGIEEQRVRVQLDLLDPVEKRPALGDGYRVEVKLTIWRGDGLLQVPQSALFRQDGGWAVFRRVEGRAVATPVLIGRQTADRAEVTDGLAEGEEVILYPARTLEDGSRIVPRG
jgi:HlyD family secretion protein